jgi:acetyl-CoA carboxylase carboxyl transferase subunit alpha
LWRSWEYKEQAAEALKLTGTDMLKNGLIDKIIKEPLGGAHSNKEAMFKTLKTELKRMIKELKELSPEELVNQRIEKFGNMGVYEEI